jgi:SAM-dependent methyltransferase
MAEAAVPMTPHAICRRFLLGDLESGMKVLDIGCGSGTLMHLLEGLGCKATGVEISRTLLRHCNDAGLTVVGGTAEQLPFSDGQFDAIVCSVVLPYTDERQAVGEWARVLKAGGLINVTCHGLGYGLDYLSHGPGWKRRFYGLRMLANTFYYRLRGRRLPGFLGDTICQTSTRMRSYYVEAGLALGSMAVAGAAMGQPQFICHRVVKHARNDRTTVGS